MVQTGLFPVCRLGNGYRGDIAIDDISYTVGYCGSNPVTTSTTTDTPITTTPAHSSLDCSFDDVAFQQGFCFWQQLTDDVFDWSRGSQGTPSTSTGPSADHTTGTSGTTSIRNRICLFLFPRA